MKKLFLIFALMVGVTISMWAQTPVVKTTKENGELMEFGGAAPSIHHNYDRQLEEIIDRHCFKQLDEFRKKQQ